MNVFIDIDIDIFKSDLIDIDIDIDIFKTCRYIDNRYDLSIYRTPLEVTKNRSFQDCAKIVLWLSTAGIENPGTPKTHSSASNFHKYHPDTPRHLQATPRNPQDTPKAYPENTRRQQTPIDTNRQPQKPQSTARCCVNMSVGVCWLLLASAVVYWCLVFSGHVSGVSWGCLGVVWGYLSDIYGNWRRWNVFWGYLGSIPCSTEP